MIAGESSWAAVIHRRLANVETNTGFSQASTFIGSQLRYLTNNLRFTYLITRIAIEASRSNWNPFIFMFFFFDPIWRLTISVSDQRSQVKGY